jgi:hypothetical protein
MKVTKTDSGFKVTVKLNKTDASGYGKTKDDAIEHLVKSMARKINSLEKEVNSMYKFQSYIKNVITGAGC